MLAPFVDVRYELRRSVNLEGSQKEVRSEARQSKSDSALLGAKLLWGNPHTIGIEMSRMCLKPVYTPRVHHRGAERVSEIAMQPAKQLEIRKSEVPYTETRADRDRSHPCADFTWRSRLGSHCH